MRGGRSLVVSAEQPKARPPRVWPVDRVELYFAPSRIAIQSAQALGDAMAWKDPARFALAAIGRLA